MMSKTTEKITSLEIIKTVVVVVVEEEEEEEEEVKNTDQPDDNPHADATSKLAFRR
jgi:hypothetical protein